MAKGKNKNKSKRKPTTTNNNNNNSNNNNNIKEGKVTPTSTSTSATNNTTTNTTTNNNNKDIQQQIEKLIQNAEHAINTLQPDLAAKFYERILEIDQTNTNIMITYGELCMQFGESELALSLFQRAVHFKPNDLPSAWLYLGQLQQSYEAMNSFQKGVSILIHGLEKRIYQKKDHIIMKQLCSAYCSMAELYLTDLCMEENAEQQCSDALQAASKYDTMEDNYELYQYLASLRLSQCNTDEAVKCVKESYRRLKYKCDTITNLKLSGSQGQDNNNNNNNSNDDDMEELPSMNIRVALGKLLLECGQYDTICNDFAADIFHQVKLENDENCEIWYLMGVALFTMSEPDLECSREHLEKAHMMFMKIKDDLMKQGETVFPYEMQVNQITEQLNLVKEAEIEEEAKIAAGGTIKEEEEEEEDESENENDMDL